MTAGELREALRPLADDTPVRTAMLAVSDYATDILQAKMVVDLENGSYLILDVSRHAASVELPEHGDIIGI